MLLVFSQSCGDDDDDNEEEVSSTETPVVTGTNPEEGASGAALEITGTNFSEELSEVEVSIGGEVATVNSTTGTTIACIVPVLESGAAAIVVTIDGTSSSSYSGFRVLEAVDPAVVTSFTPDNRGFEDEVTIKGSNFGDDEDIVTVTINDKEQTIASFSDTEIKITLTEKTFSGELIVWKSGVKNEEEFSYSYDVDYEVVDFYESAGVI